LDAFLIGELVKIDKCKSDDDLVINDPIHGIIEFKCSEQFPVKEILNHPRIQRLRHIKQLGMADLVFPGAVHTRFNHSLGAAHLAGRILGKLQPTGIDQDQVSITILAALLHDIGHGPFSHAFEILTKGEGLESISHEDWTPYFLKDMASVLNTKSAAFIEAVVSSKGNAPQGPLQVLSDVVSSQLDADRLDYLLRDSHFCGVSYGQYDLNWLLQCMEPITGEGENRRLGVSSKGVGAVEGFLMARRLMTKSVYHHPTVSLLQFLTMCFLKESCIAIHELSIQALCPTPLRKFLEGLELYRRNKLTKNDFMRSYFPEYRILTDHSVYQWIETTALYENKFPKNISELGKKLYYRRLPKIFRIPKHRGDTLRNEVTDLLNYQGLKDWQIGLIENSFTTYKNSSELILVKNSDISEVSKYSSLINGLANQEEASAFLYIDSSLLDKKPISALLKGLKNGQK
jgi:HD superfamily phosphohydrolase